MSSLYLCSIRKTQVTLLIASTRATRLHPPDFSVEDMALVSCTGRKANVGDSVMPISGLRSIKVWSEADSGRFSVNPSSVSVWSRVLFVLIMALVDCAVSINYTIVRPIWTIPQLFLSISIDTFPSCMSINVPDPLEISTSTGWKFLIISSRPTDSGGISIDSCTKCKCSLIARLAASTSCLRPSMAHCPSSTLIVTRTRWLSSISRSVAPFSPIIKNSSSRSALKWCRILPCRFRLSASRAMLWLLNPHASLRIDRRRSFFLALDGTRLFCDFK